MPCGFPVVACSTRATEAQRWYNDAYDEIAKAKKEADGGNAKGLEKRWKKALDRGLRATDLDPKYHEAWNLVGYASRKLGKYDDALKAYDKCLALKPDFAPAHEYRGEAYLEMGRIADARAELAALEKLGAADDAKTLQAALEAKAGKDGGGSMPAAPATAAADSSGGGK